MALTLSQPAVPRTRLRLVYRINAGALARISSGVSTARNRIEAAWRDEGGRIPAYMVLPPTDPVLGGSPGAGALGVLSFVAGRSDYYTALEIKTDSMLPSGLTYAQLLGPMQRISLGLLGADARADLDHVDLVGAGAPVADRTLQQQVGKDAQQSRERDPGAKLLDAVGKLLIILAVVAGVGIVIVAARRA
jgi:hypothetical protein